ncbi:MAG: uracil-DNA glycosylase [Parvibaculaceae bacterium]
MTHFDGSDDNLTREEAFARLSFYVEAGVADVFTETVNNRYQQEASPSVKEDARAPLAVTDTFTATQGITGRTAPARATPPAAPALREATPMALDDGAAIASAKSLAAGASTLDDVRDALASFEGCGLRATAKNLVFEDGNREARIMFVGEAPLADDDLDGKPFSGEAGVLLDRMLAAIGLDRSSVYLSNLLPWRPPGNRHPSPGEEAMCLPFITRQIELSHPDILVCFGGVAAKQLLNADAPLLRLRGEWKNYIYGSGTQIPALTMFSPDYLLRHPAHKRLAWRDLQSLQARTAELPPRH